MTDIGRNVAEPPDADSPRTSGFYRDIALDRTLEDLGQRYVEKRAVIVRDVMTPVTLNQPSATTIRLRIFPPWRSRHVLPRTRGKQSPQMLAIDSARVRRSEDACQTPVFGHDCAADLMRGHVLEDHVESRTRIDGVGLRHIGISNEELVGWREAHLGIESPFHIAVGENADKRFIVEHRKVSDPVLRHQPASTTQAVGDIDRVRKGGHHRRNGRDMVHADCGFKPDAGQVRYFAKGSDTRRLPDARNLSACREKSRMRGVRKPLGIRGVFGSHIRAAVVL